MNKILSCALAAVSSLMLLSGCEDVDKEQYINEIKGAPANSAESSKDDSQNESKEATELANVPWTDMKFMFDGTVYTLDIRYSDMVSAGWSFNASAYGLESFSIEPGVLLAKSINLEKEGYPQNVFSVGLTNRGSSPVGIEDSIIWAAGISCKDIPDCPETVLPGDVKFGMSLDEIKAVYGEPVEEERYDEEGYTEYRYTENSVNGLYLDFYDDGGFCAFTYVKYV
ncbi:MAG: hypothetical protein ACI4I9_05045 [Porcipelethomonas sp.]